MYRRAPKVTADRRSHQVRFARDLGGIMPAFGFDFDHFQVSAATNYEVLMIC
jgi:hypothetical protein